MLRRRSLIRSVAAAAMAWPFVSACGESQAGPEAKSLVVYSGRSEFLVGPLIEQFGSTAGVDVRVKYAGTPQLAAVLLEEQGSSPADVFFAQEPGGLGVVEGLLAPMPEALLKGVPSWARSPDGLWTGVSGRARVIVYNTDRLVPDDLPTDLWGLTESTWRGRVGWPPTNASFQTMVTGMRAMWGDEQTREWLVAMQANEPVSYPRNTPIVAAVAAGEIDVGLVNHYYLHRFLAEQGEAFPARNHHLVDGGPGSLVMVAGIGILRSAVNRGEAEQFVELLLSMIGQQYFASQTYEYPLIDGVATGRALTPISEINKPVIALNDLKDIAVTQGMLRAVGVLS